ncbi:MAG: hypothetical protein GX416_09815 [Bacteroidales bacterium]|nr:hypothetical protein [Bacteroidales bacterium]
MVRKRSKRTTGASLLVSFHTGLKPQIPQRTPYGRLSEMNLSTSSSALHGDVKLKPG